MISEEEFHEINERRVELAMRRESLTEEEQEELLSCEVVCSQYAEELMPDYNPEGFFDDQIEQLSELGYNIFQILKEKGYEFSEEELEQYRKLYGKHGEI